MVLLAIGLGVIGIISLVISIRGMANNWEQAKIDYKNWRSK